MGDEVLPIGALLFLAQVVNLPTAVETMRHVVPIGGDYEILDHLPEIRGAVRQGKAARSLALVHVMR